jgi:hypothetical protein
VASRQRCPECGFGFNRDAIIRISLRESSYRDWAYRRMTMWAALSMALSWGAPISAVPGVVRMGLIPLLLFLALALRSWANDCESWWAAMADALAVHWIVAIGFATQLVLLFSGLAVLLAWGPVVAATYIWFTTFRCEPFADRNVTGRERAALRRHQVLAIGILIAAGLQLLLAA